MNSINTDNVGKDLKLAYEEGYKEGLRENINTFFEEFITVEKNVFKSEINYYKWAKINFARSVLYVHGLITDTENKNIMKRIKIKMKDDVKD